MWQWQIYSAGVNVSFTVLLGKPQGQPDAMAADGSDGPRAVEDAAEMMVRVTAKEVCDPEPTFFRLAVPVGSTVGAVKRALQMRQPAWAPEKQLVARAGIEGALDDAAPAAGGDLLCWVACVCQRRPIAGAGAGAGPWRFVPPDYDDAAGAPAAVWEDVID